MLITAKITAVLFSWQSSRLHNWFRMNTIEVVARVGIEPTTRGFSVLPKLYSLLGKQRISVDLV